MYTQIQAEYEKYNKLIEEIKESYGTLTTTNALTDPIGQGGVSIFNFLWNNLGSVLKTIGTNSDSANNIFGLSISNNGILNVVNSILPVIQT